MLLFTNCEVHTGNIRTEVFKYAPNDVISFKIKLDMQDMQGATFN